MKDRTTVFRCERSIAWDAVKVFAFNRRDRDPQFWKMVPGEVAEEGAYFPEPTMTLEYAQAQTLMDELWQCGLRPTEGTGSAGSLAATERHLKDMQGIAMALLRKDGAAV